MGVTIDDARAIAATLPRSYEALVRDHHVALIGVAVIGGDIVEAWPSSSRRAR